MERLFRKHYRMSGKCGKNDAADAAAICEAVIRRQMRFVPVKEEHQQIILSLHRTRQGFVEERTATYNRLRGLISEFGIVLPQKVANLRRDIIEHLEDVPGYVNQCVGDLLAHADALDVRIDDYDRIIAKAAREDARRKRANRQRTVQRHSAAGRDFRRDRTEVSKGHSSCQPSHEEGAAKDRT